jgi:hypothetical protein
LSRDLRLARGQRSFWEAKDKGWAQVAEHLPSKHEAEFKAQHYPKKIVIKNEKKQGKEKLRIAGGPLFRKLDTHNCCIKFQEWQ